MDKENSNFPGVCGGGTVGGVSVTESYRNLNGPLKKLSFLISCDALFSTYFLKNNGNK